MRGDHLDALWRSSSARRSLKPQIFIELWNHALHGDGCRVSGYA
jgi:hypothetical protein